MADKRKPNVIVSTGRAYVFLCGARHDGTPRFKAAELIIYIYIYIYIYKTHMFAWFGNYQQILVFISTSRKFAQIGSLCLSVVSILDDCGF